ncbi:tyrosine-type recombinase/integrase [Stutzerimonas nosocomialis]|uniref:tyrosine-type recombinase/integrase n=1 Tax=Stutzerimonas nosocomialis TaxID=1056496 RepID=UPI001F4FB547|nr:tyrosine-type recombinase/integrase [Stutzerimonas nosocomialis]
MIDRIDYYAIFDSNIKKLKITKGADSSREALSPEQVAELMAKAQRADSWVRWSVSLAALTGARIGELHQLTKEDVRQVGDVWVIDINSREGKTLKNRYSARLVPLVDGAYGFDLEAFLRFVEAETAGARLFDQGYGYFSQVNNSFLREALSLEADRVQSFHSLRHSMASRLKACGVPVGIAQDILGHSSQSISYDLYGGDQRVAVEKLAAALAVAFRSTSDQAEGASIGLTIKDE